MAASRTVREAARDAAHRFRRAGVPEPAAEADLLLAHVLGLDRGGLVARAGEVLSVAAAERFEGLVRRRAEREPFQYVVGEQEFWGRAFRVDSRVLVPRPETEGVVEAALSLRPPAGARIADLGTGSGCLAVTLAAERDDVRLFALDRSPGALEVARENARRHGLADRIEFRLGNMTDPPDDWKAAMDVVVSNPPYVSRDEWLGLEPEVRDHEPQEALVPGPTGLEIYRLAAPAIRGLLRPGGAAVVELGLGRRHGACRALEAAGLEVVAVRPDLRGIPRVVVARARRPEPRSEDR
jgi:release factor glutamine methyltransferase